MKKFLPEELYLANSFKRLRYKRNFTQLELAAKAEVSLTHLRNIEKAKANPTLDILKRLSKALGVRIVIIFVEDTAVEGEKDNGRPLSNK